MNHPSQYITHHQNQWGRTIVYLIVGFLFLYGSPKKKTRLTNSQPDSKQAKKNLCGRKKISSKKIGIRKWPLKNDALKKTTFYTCSPFCWWVLPQNLKLAFKKKNAGEKLWFCQGDIILFLEAGIQWKLGFWESFFLREGGCLLPRLWYWENDLELGVIYFPTSWVAKEPKNLPNHRVVGEDAKMIKKCYPDFGCGTKIMRCHMIPHKSIVKQKWWGAFQTWKHNNLPCGCGHFSYFLDHTPSQVTEELWLS